MKRLFLLLPLLALAAAAVAWVFHKRAGKTIPLPTDSGDPPWAAIDEAFQCVYPDQKNPKHFANPIPKQLGGPSHLDGFAVYETDDCYHIVTLGLSAAFTEDENANRTGVCGMEFSLKLRKASLRSGDEEAEIKCVCGILDSVAAMTFEIGEVFPAAADIYTGQTAGVDARRTSKLTGFVLIKDTTVPFADTPRGRISIVEFVGCTDAELRAVREDKISIEELVRKIGSDLTDYKRDSVL